MEFYLATVDPVPGERMVIDYEENGCKLDDLLEAVEVLKADSRQLQVTVYSGHLLKEQLNGSCNEYLRDNTDLWLAQYTSGNPTWSDGTYEHWTLWQYSETGEVDGIDDSYVDLNEFNGDNTALVEWISPRGSTPKPPTPKPPKLVVDVAIDAPAGVGVHVTVNGKERHKRKTIRRGADT